MREAGIVADETTFLGIIGAHAFRGEMAQVLGDELWGDVTPPRLTPPLEASGLSEVDLDHAIYTFGLDVSPMLRLGPGSRSSQAWAWG